MMPAARHRYAASMKRSGCAAALLAALFGYTSADTSAHAAALDEAPSVLINDNRHPAGHVDGKTLVLELQARIGRWHPEGDSGVTIEVEAFGEKLGAPQVPAPLIRVREGTTIVATIQNDLATELKVNGLCVHDGSPCAPVAVPPGATRSVRFAAGRPGTYHYWGTTTGMPLMFRGAHDTQLSGAFIVDPAEGELEADRVFVITEWTGLSTRQLGELVNAPDVTSAFLAMNLKPNLLINGRSWPHTERLTYEVDDRVRWRLVNLTTLPHPMHLHGFYFEVESGGDGRTDEAIETGARQRVVTQVLAPGRTMRMAWRAERTGNWLFHCHIVDHVSPKWRLTESHTAHAEHDAAGGMAGMVLGITITDHAHVGTTGTATRPSARQVKLTLTSKGPGPTLAVKRGEAVEVTVVNSLAEATAIHWHGMELESYYDGVHGWSGDRTRVSPMIEPGATFIARFTPPRAGTFIYHTHLHDDHQLTSGLYGALVVLEPDEVFDAARDHVIVIGGGGTLGHASPVLLNGERDPLLVWKAGTTHRLRLINITPGEISVASLGTLAGPATWRPLAKDGAAVSIERRTPAPATLTIAAGETYDFEYEAPPGRQNLWFNVRTPAGRWQAQARVAIMP